MPAEPRSRPRGGDRRRPAFPGRKALAAGLEALGVGRGPVTVLRRQRNVYASTFPSEVVTCRPAGGGERRLFCKYAAGRSHRDHGHRGDVAYEALVYRRVLRDIPLPLPAFYGTLETEGEGTWLVLEFLEDALRVSKVPDPGMSRAAAWAGAFHGLNGDRLRREPLSFLRAYDEAFYAGWARRTLERARAVRPFPGWLPAVCRRYEEMAGLLGDGSRTVIHGEFTPHNVLWQDGRVVPIDWESAALGAGEIDLALLLEGWDEATARACAASYQQARWPGRADPSFGERLGAARLYVTFRWLAGCSAWTAARRPPGYLQELRRLAEGMGLV